MTTTITKALNAVMNDVQAVRKQDRNQAQGFNFRGIDAVVNAVGPALRTHGVVVLPEVMSYEYGTVEIGKNRTPMGHVKVWVCYRFFGPEGDQLSTTVVAEAMDSGDKATAKAMSVAFRTALLQALALPTDEPDPDHDSYERATTKTTTETQAPKVTPELLAKVHKEINEAPSVEALDAIATKMKVTSLDPKDRMALVEAWVVRKQELTEGAN